MFLFIAVQIQFPLRFNIIMASVLKGIFALILKLLNILIHSIGLHLLRCLHNRGRENVQIIYIINLSVTELVVNIFSFLRNFMRIFSSTAFRSRSGFRHFVMYTYLLDYAVFKFCLYAGMIYITIDRVCGVLLNLTYPCYWNITKAIHLVHLTWSTGFFVFVVSGIVYGFYPNSKNVFLIGNYFIIVFDILFVIIALISYGSIFNIFRKTRTNSFLGRNEKSQESLWKVFRNSRFYVSVLIVTTFIIFTILPNLLWTFHVVRETDSVFGFMLSTSYAISYLIDGAIYIFMDDQVKRTLWRKLRKYPVFRHLLPKNVRRRGEIRYGVRFKKVYIDQPKQVQPATDALLGLEQPNRTSTFLEGEVDIDAHIDDDGCVHRERVLRKSRITVLDNDQLFGID